MALQNDWIVAGINNPDFTVSDFANFADLTTENTQLLGVDDYIKTDFIQNCPYFRDDAGNFNEDLFRSYYASRAQEFDTFAQDEFYRGPALDIFDLDRTQETPVRDIGFNITRGFNPDRQQIGVEGVNVWSDPKFSQRELAKQNRVFNTERGEFEDWSVDDHTLVSNVKEWFKDLWRDPLVLATWDDDGVHVDPMTGLPQQHVKGQPKLNDKGTYYYETLGNRSVLGKDVLSVFDTFTVDGEGLNKYDFFDSNDLHKSVGGTVMKNIAMLIPTFIPYVGQFYSGYLVARELSKTLPMITGMVTSLTGGETPQWAETASAWAQRATPSMDDWSMQHPWAAGHFIGLVTDLALLSGQQKFIAEALGATRGGQRFIAEAQANAQKLFQSKAMQYGAGEDVWRACLSRFMPQAEKMAVRSGQLGRDLGLAYIALTFQHSTYDEMLQRGASKQEASAVALGAILGMFSVDKWLHLGEIFYDDATGETTKIAKRVVKDELKRSKDSFDKLWAVKKDVVEKAAKESGGNQMKILETIRKAKDWAHDALSRNADAFRYHSLTATGKMLGSGVERVAETLAGDVSKGLYELAGQFGAPTTIKDAGAFENMTDRYGMAFTAGVLGSGIHYASELLKRGTLKVPNLDQSIETLVRNGYADEMRSEVDRLEKAGRTGSRSLSAFRETKDKDGRKIGYETVSGDDPDDMSQGHFVAEAVRQNINMVEAVLKGNDVNFTDDEAFENAVFGERRLMQLKELAKATGFYDRLSDNYTRLTTAAADLALAEKSLDGTPGGVKMEDAVMTRMLKEYGEASEGDKSETEWGRRLENIRQSREEFDAALAAVRGMQSGEQALDFARMLSFAANPRLSDQFLNVTMDQFSESEYHKSVGELTSAELNEFLKRWGDQRNGELKTSLETMWEKYKAMERVTAPVLAEDEAADAEYAKWGADIWGTLWELTGHGRATLTDGIIKKGGRLPGESEEEWRAATTRADGESEKDFAARSEERARAVRAVNEKYVSSVILEVQSRLDEVGWRVDPMTLRMIRQLLDSYGRPADIIGRVMAGHNGVSDFVKGQMRSLKPDLSNADEVVTEVRKGAEDSVRERLTTVLEGYLGEITDIDVMLKPVDGAEDGETKPYERPLLDYLEKRFGKDEDGNTLPKRMTPREFRDEIMRKGSTILDGLTEESAEEVRGLMNDFVVGSGFGRDFDSAHPLFDHLVGFVNAGDYEESVIAPQAKAHAAKAESDAKTIISEVREDPYMELLGRLKSDVRNPVEEKLKRLADANGIEIPRGVTELLHAIWDDYDSLESVSQFALRPEMQNEIDGIKPLVRMLRVYIEAASTKPGAEAPFGQNRWYNEFIEAHKNMLPGVTEKLPEMPDDLAMLYDRVLITTERELERWHALSERNLADKRERIRQTDATLARMNHMTLSKLPDTIKYKGKTYTGMREGFSDADADLLGTDDALLPVAQEENAFYRNVERIAKELDMSVVSLAEDPEFMSNFVEGGEELLRQDNVRIVSGMDENSPAYARLMYIATVLSEPPAEWYRFLKGVVDGEGSKAPIGTQEIGIRMIRAMMKGNLGRIVSGMFRNIRDAEGRELETPEMIKRFIIGTGGAGVGKTSVLAGTMVRLIEDLGIEGDIVLLGPNPDVTAKLEETLGLKGSERSRRMTVDEFLEAKVKDYGAIAAEFDTKVDADELEFKTDHFEKGVMRGFPFARLTDKVEYVGTEKAPAVVLIDESTNLNTVQGLLLDGYMDAVGRYGLMTGDFTQITARTRSGLTSLEEGSVFAMRTPELTISIRSGNSQKIGNEQRMKSLIDMINDDMRNVEIDEAAFDANLGTYRRLARSLGLAYYYDGSDVKGTMFVERLDDGLLGCLKGLSEGKRADGSNVRVAFIGEKGSETLNTLLRAGVRVETPDQRTLETMKGSEFDYVVVDQSIGSMGRFGDGADETEGHVALEMLRGSGEGRSDIFLDILRNIYTLDTRSVEGTVFLDPSGEYEQFVGAGVKTSSVAESMEMQSIVGGMKAMKRALLGKIVEKLGEPGEPYKGAVERDAEKAAAEAKGEVEASSGGDGKGGAEGEDAGVGAAVKVDGTDGASEPGGSMPPKREFMEDSERRSEKSKYEERIRGMVRDIAAEDGAMSMDSVGVPEEERGDGGTPHFNTEAVVAGRGYEHETYGLTVLSAEGWGSGEDWKVAAARRSGLPEGAGMERAWCVRRPDNGVLRNLQCLVDGDTVITGFGEKRRLQDTLNAIRNAVLYPGGEYADLPNSVKRLVSEEDWGRRKIGLEFREVMPGEAMPLYYHMDRLGIKPQGSSRRIWANFVLLFDGADMAKPGGRRTYSIDLAGMNDPGTLAANVESGRLQESFRKASANAGKSGDAELAKRMATAAETVGAASGRYSGKFGDIVAALKERKYEPLLFDVNGMVTPNGRTWIADSRGAAVRLNGEIDPRTIDKAGTFDPEKRLVMQDYMRLNPDMRISDVYVAVGHNIEKLGLPPAVNNNAVVFATGDTNYMGDLARGYIGAREAYDRARRNGAPSSPASIRMIPLQNFGMTIRQMSDMMFMSKLGLGDEKGEEVELDATKGRRGSGGKSAYVRKPLNQNYTGIGMFMSLWNSRAALLDFCGRVREWMGGNYAADGPLGGAARSHTPEKVRFIARAFDRVHYGESPDAIRMELLNDADGHVKSLFSAYELASESAFRAVLDDLRTFNDVTLKDLPYFRLGSYMDRKGYAYGFHIQRSDSVDGKWYKGAKEANMCYLTAECAGRFVKMLNAFLDPLTGKDGLFRMAREVRDAAGRVTGDTPFGVREYIDEGNDSDTDMLYRLPTRIEKSEDGIVDGVQYRNSQYFTLMTRMVRKVLDKAYAVEKRGVASGMDTVVSVKWRNLSKEALGRSEGEVRFDVADLIPGAGDEGGRFVDMLSLLFHGTVEDIHRPFGRGGPGEAKGLVQMSGVKFRYGFFIEPGIDAGDKVSYHYESPDGDGFIDFIKCTTAGNMFYVKGFLRGANLRMPEDVFNSLNVADATDAETMLSRRGSETETSRRSSGGGRSGGLPDADDEVVEADSERVSAKNRGAEVRGGNGAPGEVMEVTPDTVHAGVEDEGAVAAASVSVEKAWRVADGEEGSLVDTFGAVTRPIRESGVTAKAVRSLAGYMLENAGARRADPDGWAAVSSDVMNAVSKAGYMMREFGGEEISDASGYDVVGTVQDENVRDGFAVVEGGIELSRAGRKGPVALGKPMVVLRVGRGFDAGARAEAPEMPKAPPASETKAVVKVADGDAPSRNFVLQDGVTIGERLGGLLGSEDFLNALGVGEYGRTILRGGTPKVSEGPANDADRFVLKLKRFMDAGSKDEFSKVRDEYNDTTDIAHLKMISRMRAMGDDMKRLDEFLKDGQIC